MWACKHVFHIQVLVISFFFQPRTHENWNWDSKIGGGLVIANHLDQSVWWANRKYWAAVRSYITCYTLRASPAVRFQYVSLQKYFSHPSLVISCSFPTPHS
jgi:hypothetical protein